MITATTRVVVYLLAAVLLLSAQPPAGQQGRGGKSKAKSKSAAPAQPGFSIPVDVVELFTSEGCSSCPPADRLVAALESSSGHFIVLGEHVDYWDADGWKDRYSSPLFSARQQEYGTATRSANVFTPQVVVNGRASGTASDAFELSRALQEGAYKGRATVELSISEAKTLSLKVSKLPEGGNKADVLLAIAESGIETQVGAGENAGVKLRHVPVVHSLTQLTELDPDKPGEYGAQVRLNVRPEWNRDNLRVVVLVQDQKNLHILGAGMLLLSKETTEKESLTKR
jgi:hypothetical protein